MGNNICHDIKNSFIKNPNLLIYTIFRKSSFPIDLGYGRSDLIIICILIVPDDSVKVDRIFVILVLHVLFDDDN